MKLYLRNAVFIVTSILFYLIWSNGGELVYGNFLKKGMERITTNFSSIEEIRLENSKKSNEVIIHFKYPDRKTNISMEYCLPIVLLFAWQFSVFFDPRIKKRIALKFFTLNFTLVFILQTLLPLLLFNVSQSKVKSVSLFIGLQLFGFIVFFLILKDSIVIKSIANRQRYTSNT